MYCSVIKFKILNTCLMQFLNTKDKKYSSNF